MGRALCLFTRIDASKAPDKQKDDLVALAVRRAAPFLDPDFSVAWGPDGQAAVWYWSRSRVVEILADRQISARRIQFTAQALHVHTGCTSGGELLLLDEGVEGRVWRNGTLIADRWWKDVPSDLEWREFLRGAGWQAHDAEVPEPVPVELSSKPWGTRARRLNRGLRLADADDYYMGTVATLGLAFVLVASLQLGMIARNWMDGSRAEKAISGLDDELARILAARNATDRNMEEIRNLLALQDSAPLLALLAEASRLMPESDWRIKHWNQPTPAQLELTLSMPDTNPELLVQRWESSPMFDGVTADIVGRSGEVVIHAGVIGIDHAADAP